MQLRLQPLRIPFKVAFRHASAERSETSSLWAEAVGQSGVVGYGESCPRPYVTAETLDTAISFFKRHQTALCDDIVDLGSLRGWIAVHESEIDANPAAWCAIELAILDLLAKEAGQTLEAFLGLPLLQGRFQYTAVLGDAGSDAFRAIAEQYRRQGFKDFKVKLSGDLQRDAEKIAILRSWNDPSLRVRVDANNLWERADEAIAFVDALNASMAAPIFAVEEPIRPNQYAELARIAAALDCKIILDESFLRISQVAFLQDMPARWLVNVRISKMGGLLRSLAIAEATRIGIIVGAQVGETSLLTRIALTVARAAGPRLIAQEGAFGTFLLHHDVCDPPLMFGAGGILDVDKYHSLSRPGIGLSLV